MGINKYFYYIKQVYPPLSNYQLNSNSVMVYLKVLYINQVTKIKFLIEISCKCRQL